MTWHRVREWLVLGLFSTVSFFAVRSMDRVEKSLEAMSDNVQELNTKIAVIIYQTGNLEGRVERLEGGKKK